MHKHELSPNPKLTIFRHPKRNRNSTVKSWTGQDKKINHQQIYTPQKLTISDELVKRLEQSHQKNVILASLDIKNLYYSLSRRVFWKRVREELELNAIDFQSKGGILIDTLLELIR